MYSMIYLQIKMDSIDTIEFPEKYHKHAIFGRVLTVHIKLLKTEIPVTCAETTRWSNMRYE